MFLAKVIGNVVSTQKNPKLVGNKLLIVRRIDVDEKFIDNPIVVTDNIGAGVNETVLVITGSSARFGEGGSDTPVDATIVGIVDYIEVNK
jgi:ethanolamine utilization protein EutN